MEAERWRKIESICHEVRGVPSSRRDAILLAKCGGDEDLRDEVASLLAQFSDAAVSFPLMPGAAELDEAFAAGERIVHGQRVGRYEIEAILASGGMADVYRARDTRLGRSVALKFPRTALSADPQNNARFQREAEIVSALNHPNIVTLYDVGEWEGRQYLVTELVDGQTLREQMAGGPMPVAQVVTVGRQIASALAAAHLAGVMHRDIKPENVMIRSDGVVRVLDFGLAKAAVGVVKHRVKGGSVPTQPGIMMGTLRYMSPEQLRGESLDFRTDLWSLGVVLYELLAGRPPFRGETAGHLAVSILESTPDSPDDGSLGVLILKLLQKPREDRPQSAESVFTQLDQWHLNDLSVVRRGVHRMSGSAAVMAALAAGLAALAALGYFRMVPRPARKTLAQSSMSTVTANGRVQYAAVSPDGRFLAFSVKDVGQESLWVRQLAASTDRQLVAPSRDRYRGMTVSPEGDYIYYAAYGKTPVSTLWRIPVLGGTPKRVLEDVDSPITFAPGGRSFAFIRSTPGENRLIVAQVETGEERVAAVRKAPFRFREVGPAWSPDGRKIAVAAREPPSGDLKVEVFDLAAKTGKALGPAWMQLDRMVWQPSGDGLLVTAVLPSWLTSEVAHVGFPGGAVEQVTHDIASYYGVTLQSDGSAAVAVRSETLSYVSLANLRGLPSRRLTSTRTVPGGGVAMTPEGSVIVSLMEGGAVDLWAFSSSSAGAPERITNDSSIERDPAPCGPGRLVFSGNRAGLWNIWRIGSDGRNATRLTNGLASDFAPRCTQDGRTVIFESDRSGTLALWIVSADGGEPRQLTGGVCQMPAISRDGNAVACQFAGPQSAARRVVGIFGMDGRLLQLLEGIPSTSPLSWDPNGKAIIYADTKGEVSNLWRKTLASGAARQITRFEQDRILDFDLSPDGTSAACLRGVPNDDAVMIQLAGSR